MKRIHSLSLIALFTLAIASASCKDGKGIGSFSATVDGESWSALAPTGAKTGNRLTITGLSVDKQIVMNIGGTTVGTYDMTLIEGSIQPFIYTPSLTQSGAANTYVGTSGSIEITGIDESRVSGTFSLTATNQSLGPIGVSGTFTDIKYF